MALSTDGHLLASVGALHGCLATVKVWAVKDGRQLGSFTIETGKAPLLAVSNDGLLLALSTDESRISLWEVNPGKERWSVPLTSAITAVAFSEESGAVLVWCVDKSVLELASSDGSFLKNGRATATSPK
jgi:WD40 repeat protein